MKKLTIYAVALLCILFLNFEPAFATSSSDVTETIFFGNVKDDSGGCGVFSILNLVIDIFSIGVGVLGITGITIAGIQYMTASGNEEKVRKSKNRIFQIIIGLALYALIYAGINWLVPGGKLNTDYTCSTISDEELASIKAEEKAKLQESIQKTTKSTNTKQETSNTPVNIKTTDGEPACSLTYDSTTGELTFKQTKNATKYAIAKEGKSPSYERKPVIYHPGKDRYNSTEEIVKLSYTGYVKNSKNKLATCSATVNATRGVAAVEYAKTFLGTRYCHYWNKARKNWYGQKDLKCTDCSGFTGGIYSHLLGYHISRRDDHQCRGTGGLSYRVSLKEAKAGDILCYGSPKNYSHVAFYLGKVNKKGYPYAIQMGGGKGKVWSGVYKRKFHHIVRIKGTN